MKKIFLRKHMETTSNLEMDSSFQIKQQSVKKNLFFQISYQVIILLIPLLTAGYVTRTLGDTNLGNYSYVNSIAYYFIVFSMLGISTYGQRTISSVKKNGTELRHTFWSLFYVHLTSSIIAIIAYIIFVLFFVNENQLMYYLDSIFVISALFDITWLFSGLENFQSVVIKNLIIKILSVICLFVFVHTKNDIFIYIMISSISSLLGNLLLWPQAVKTIKPIKVTYKECLCHIKPILLFFSIAVAVALYTVFDKTLLGIFASKEDVAYYDYADRIIQIPKGIMGAITTVMLPRSCALVAENNIKEAKKYIRYSITMISLLGFGSMFGFLAIGKNLAILYYGEAFSKSGDMLLWMSPLPYIVCMGSVFRQQYMIPKKMDKAYTAIIFANSLINLILSLVFLPLFGPYGVIVGTLAAEFFGMIAELFISKDVVSIKDLVLAGFPFIVIGGFMYILLELLQKYCPISIGYLVLFILVGFIFYSVLSVLYLFMIDKNRKEYKDILNRILIKVHFKKNHSVNKEETDFDSKN
jgi:O-antigen/teichoic acid export membrane protein